MAHIVKPLANWIQTSIMIGKQMIMRKWKDAEGPLFQDWLTELGKVAAMCVHSDHCGLLLGGCHRMRVEVVWVQHRDLFTGRLTQPHTGQ